jgi:hypothetical protein
VKYFLPDLPDLSVKYFLPDLPDLLVKYSFRIFLIFL